jgi:flagellar biosynthesis protein FlhG
VREHGLVEIPQPEIGRRGGAPAFTVAVTGGKGGVGKTQVAANVALALAGRGLKTLAVDLDLGLANLDVLFGATARRDIRHILDSGATYAECVLEVSGGLHLLPGSSGVSRMASLDAEDRERMWAAVRQAGQGYQAVVYDTAAGLGPTVIEGLCRADRVIIVTTPDPAALTDAYALLKVLVTEHDDVPPVSLVVNLAVDAGEVVTAFRKLRRVVRGYLKTDLELMAGITRDPAVVRASRLQKPLLLDCPGSPAAKMLDRIGGRLADEIRTAARRSRKDAS